MCVHVRRGGHTLPRVRRGERAEDAQGACYQCGVRRRGDDADIQRAPDARKAHAVCRRLVSGLANTFWDGR